MARTPDGVRIEADYLERIGNGIVERAAVERAINGLEDYGRVTLQVGANATLGRAAAFRPGLRMETRRPTKPIEILNSGPRSLRAKIPTETLRKVAVKRKSHDRSPSANLNLVLNKIATCENAIFILKKHGHIPMNQECLVKDYRTDYAGFIYYNNDRTMTFSLQLKPLKAA